MRPGGGQKVLLAWALLLALLAGSPFGEGGARAEALFLLHSALLCALALVLGALRPGPHERPPEGAAALEPPPGWTGFFLALVVLGISALRAPYGYAALLALVDAGAALAAFVLGGMLARGRRERRLIAWLVVASALIQALIAAGQRIGGKPGERPAGTFLNPNHLAAYLACGILAGWGLLFDRLARESGGGEETGEWRFRRVPVETAVLVAALAGLHVAFLLPASRGALVGLMAGYLAMAAFFRGRLAPAARRIVAACMLLVLLFAGAAVARRLRAGDPYFWDRTLIWRASFEAVVERPVLGVGPGQFQYAAARFSPPHEDRPVRYGKHLDQTHSDPMRLLVEGGCAGMLAGLSAFAALLLALGRGVRSALKDNDAVCPALAAAVAALMAHALVDNLSERPALVLTGAAMAGSIAALGRRSRDQRDPPQRSPSRASLILTGFGLACIYLWCVAGPYLANVAWRRSFTDPKGGGPLLERAIGLNPFHPAYHERAAEIEAFRGGSPLVPLSFAGSVLELEEARRLDPENADWALDEARLWRRALFEIFRDRSSQQAASRAYEEAERLAPRNPFIPLERATLLAAIGDAAAAPLAVDRALALEPNFLEARLVQAKLELERGRFEEARRTFAEAARRRAAAGSYQPENAYERAILNWNSSRAAELESALGRGDGATKP